MRSWNNSHRKSSNPNHRSYSVSSRHKLLRTSRRGPPGEYRWVIIFKFSKLIESRRLYFMYLPFHAFHVEAVNIVEVFDKIRVAFLISITDKTARGDSINDVFINK